MKPKSIYRLLECKQSKYDNMESLGNQAFLDFISGSENCYSSYKKEFSTI